MAVWSVPSPRVSRGAETFPRGSTKWLLLHLIREVRDEDWSAPVAARRLVLWAESDLDLLQAARARLVLCEPLAIRPSPVHERALASLDAAIGDLSLWLASSADTGDGGTGGTGG